MNEQSNQDLTFEAAMKALEDTVRKLESGELPLNEAIERYKQAMQLVQYCRAQLDRAELEIEQLVGGQTEPVQPFEEAE